ncbi:MAG: FAD-dependent oxidoreductase, partial [Actinomycetota bacterium]|nr:FAD-dependent oxidoreductase [Actinomycetota bacterium]
MTGPEAPRDAVVVGAGIAGLAAAWKRRDRDVLVREAANRLGGRVHSEARGQYWLNLGAHVFSGPGSATWRLADEVGVELRKVPGQLVAVELNGSIVAGGRPELFPFRLPLALRDRLALVRAGLRLRRAVTGYERVAERRPGESLADTRARVLAYGNDRTFADWLGPLSGDAAALFRATVTRSTAELDEIAFGHGAGYFSLVWNAGKGLSYNVLGGPGQLIDGIAEALPGK